MPIDTDTKRRSVSGLWTGFLPVAVTPDAAQGQLWRQQAGWNYAGIASAVITFESVTMGDFYVMESFANSVAVMETFSGDFRAKVD